ncbi:unnamed protein product [Lactuca saligna]|uniref:Uncharacterized protein n=1 Tax=Lactuca saligna TaxID=75948 RepID=A0AA35VQB8_LACSI|nr:unnamed protein product [Lactuca saligna]
MGCKILCERGRQSTRQFESKHVQMSIVNEIDFFMNNSFEVVFLVFFLFQLNMIGFAFMFSPTIWSFFPPNLLAKALQLLSDATSTPKDPGISWSRIGECAPNDNDCLINMNGLISGRMVAKKNVYGFWYCLLILRSSLQWNTIQPSCMNFIIMDRVLEWR